MNTRFPWKKNLLKIPPNILFKARSFTKDDCEIACVKTIRNSDLESGLFTHLNISRKEGQLSFDEEVLPKPGIGRYSKKNIYGYEDVLRDEPMVTKSWAIDTPNFGEWSKGSHEIVFEREVYQRDDYPPEFLTICIEHLGEDVRQQGQIFKFRVNRVLDRKSPSFEYHLLFALNLLQENAGTHNIYESGSTTEDYLRSLYVHWEILPPGEREQNIVRILSGVKSENPQIRARLLDRYDFLTRLKPKGFIRGASGFQRYFGAQLEDDLVVFENLEYGNAIYIMFDDWQTLSRLSRTKLLSSKERHFVRVRHTKTWKRRVQTEILHYRARTR